MFASYTLADAARAYRDMAAREYEGGAFYARRDIETLAELATLIARFSRESAELIERLNCGRPEKALAPSWSIATVVAEALDGHLNREAFTVLASALDAQTEPECAA